MVGNALLIAGRREPTASRMRCFEALRPLSFADCGDVADIYHRTYLGSPHEMTLEVAREEIARTWGGEYGQLVPEACLGATVDGSLVGAILTVQDPPWEDVPAGPFILDLFVVREHRGVGLGRSLVQAVQSAVASPIALRVDDTAPEARALYLSLGFRPAAS